MMVIVPSFLHPFIHFGVIHYFPETNQNKKSKDWKYLLLEKNVFFQRMNSTKRDEVSFGFARMHPSILLSVLAISFLFQWITFWAPQKTKNKQTNQHPDTPANLMYASWWNILLFERHSVRIRSHAPILVYFEKKNVHFNFLIFLLKSGQRRLMSQTH